MSKVRIDKDLNCGLENLNPKLRYWVEFFNSNKFTKRELQLMKNNVSEKLSKNRESWIVYRGVNRTFKDEEIKLFLNSIESLKYKTLFSLLANTGLRIGEAVRLRIENIDLEQRTIKVDTEKQKVKTIDFHPIPESIYPLLNHYIIKYKTRIDCRGGWLFPQTKHNNKHILHKIARDRFYYYRDICGLNRTYAIAHDDKNPVSKRIGHRELHNLTLHSFRHWYKYKLDRANIPYGMIRALMRHTGGSITDQYGQYSFEEKKKAVDEVFRMY